MENETKRTWQIAFACAMGLFIIAMFSPLLGLGRLIPGTRLLSKTPVFDMLFYYVLFQSMIYAVIVFPISRQFYPQYDSKTSVGARVLFTILVSLLPLASFGFYLGQIRELIHFHEILLAVFPALAVGVLFFEKTRNPMWFSFFTGIFSFLNLFVVNDVLGPFSGMWQFASISVWFYIWRTLFPMLAVAAAAWFALSGTKVQERLAFFRFASMGLTVFSLTIQFLVPKFSAVWLKKEVVEATPYDFTALLFFATAYFLFRRNRFAYRVLIGVCATEAVALVYFVSRFISEQEATFGTLSTFSVQVLSLSLFTALLIFLLKPNVQEQFQS